MLSSCSNSGPSWEAGKRKRDWRMTPLLCLLSAAAAASSSVLLLTAADMAAARSNIGNINLLFNERIVGNYLPPQSLPQLRALDLDPGFLVLKIFVIFAARFV